MSIVHSGLAYLLFTLALCSVALAVLIAVKPAEDPANSALLRKANLVTGGEILVVLLVAITGLVSAIGNGTPLTEFWIWLSMLVVAFYGAMLLFVTRPARQVVAVGGSHVKVGLQVALQMGHVLLLLVTLMLMLLKPA